MPTYGKLHKDSVPFLRLDVGRANLDESGLSFELSANMGDMAPIVRCEETGRTFTLSWQDIVNMAMDAGIGEKNEDPEDDGPKVEEAPDGG